MINRRTGVGGEEFGIQFALAMPEKWNGDFLMQGGGGGNGVVMAPLGLNAAGDFTRSYARVRRSEYRYRSQKPSQEPFDFDFMKDRPAYIRTSRISPMLRSLRWPNNSSRSTQ